MPVLDADALIEDRVLAIRRYHERIGNMRAELDVSGGIDSAVLLGLLARALGPRQLTAVYSSIHSADDFLERARLVAKAFDVPLIELDLTDVFDALVESMLGSLERSGADVQGIRERMDRDPTILGSLRSCIRAPIGRGFNRMSGGGIRHGTGNECEDRFLRFYQKGGDGEVDTNPIAMLGKGEVFQLARALGVPKRLIEALPSPDLHGVGESHNDEDELEAMTGVRWSYSRIDADTGAYTSVGTIERVSRFLDRGSEALLLGTVAPSANTMAALVEDARPLFRDYSDAEIEALLRSCRAVESATRHKANPNIPALGDRRALVDAGILTDTLPDLSG
jgi:NAD+ synthetase